MKLDGILKNRISALLMAMLLMLVSLCMVACGGGAEESSGTVVSNTNNPDDSDGSELETEEEQPPSVDETVNFSAGSEYSDGIEPGEPDTCEAPQGNRCWYVDAQAPDGGDGSFTNPYNSFELVVGYRASNSNYTTGLLQGGDYLYVKGTFLGSNHVPDGGKSIRIVIGRGSQGGSKHAPTVIKSYLGTARAVFDGEFANWSDGSSGMIHISALSSDKIGWIVIENVEIKNSRNIGISFEDNVVGAEVANVIIYDSSIEPGASSSGGIQFKLADSEHDFILRNSHIYSNRRNEDGTGYFDQANNNIGGVNILNEPSALDGSRIRVYDNIIEDEIYALRHKHSGNITTEVYSNVMLNSINGFYIRAYRDNSLHHNLIKGMQTALYADAENQNGDSNIEFYNNTVIDSEIVVHTGLNVTGYARAITFKNNIVSGVANEVVFALGYYGSNVYDLAGWSSEHNLYDRPNSTEFLKHEGTGYHFNDAIDILNETNSNKGDPLFANAGNDDYSLSENSPARGAGSEGQDLGALPYE